MSHSKLDRLCRFVASVDGADKGLMVVEFVSKLLAQILQQRNLNGNLKDQLENLSRPIGDTRMLLRFYGLIPLLKWIIHLETNGSKTKFLLLLRRLENLFSLMYFPLEHSYWLGTHKVVTFSQEKINSFSLWACRCWFANVVLKFLDLWEDYRILCEKEQGKIKEHEKLEIQKEKSRIALDLFINLSYFPLTIQHSSRTPPFPQFAMVIFGTFAAFGELYKAWNKTAV